MLDPVLFTLAVLTLLSTPGPTNTLLATSGAAVGMRRSLALVPAEGAGYAISVLTLGLVLGPVLARNPALALTLRALVGVYLLVLAVRLWRRGGIAVARDTVVTPGQVFLTTLLNPKALVFALGIIPFGAPRVWPYVVGFLLLVAIVAISWIAIGAVLGGVANRRGWDGVVPRVGAAAVGAFAVLLLVGPLLA